MNTAAAKAAWLCLPLLALLLGLAGWNPPGNFWGGIESPKAQCESYDSSRVKTLKSLSPEIYSEVKISRLIREPQNAISNFPYILIGLAIYLAAKKWVARSLGLGCIFLGIGSGLYHASLLPEWRLVDILGVYLALFGLITLGLVAVSKIQVGPFTELLIAASIWILAFLTGIRRNDVRIAGLKVFDSTYVVVAAVAIGSMLALFASTRSNERRHYIFALASLALAAPIAFAGGLGDRFGGWLAAPDALIQGHSIWHSFGALALLSAYEVFASTGYERSVFSPRC